MADRLDTPLVHTLHGPFTTDTAAFYARHGHKAALVGISRAQLASAPTGLAPIGGNPKPDRRERLAAAGAQGRLPAVDRADDPREGAPARDRRSARGRRAARLGGRHPARATAVLRPRGRPAHRRRAGPLPRRGRRVTQALAVRGRPGAADADPLGGAVRDGDGRGARLRDPGHRVPRGCGARARRRRADRLPCQRRAGDGGPIGRLPQSSPRGLPSVGQPSIATPTWSPPPTSEHAGRSYNCPRSTAAAQATL